MDARATEDYLGTLYEFYELLEDPAEGIHTTEIANRLGISKPSVCQMLRKLEREGLVRSERYGPVFLTAKGMRRAKAIKWKHRVIEYFLKDFLGCDLRSVHAEAHRLEHAFSDGTVRKLDAFLGNPTTSPFGKDIPHPDGGKEH
ncbi:metal-dependent transcriptional regulator [Candidatus Woesearchaeota archaeon]|nr:metal-dependent transcriptional regulator [Candidatus Woesearchaeota archaeon]